MSTTIRIRTGSLITTITRTRTRTCPDLTVIIIRTEPRHLAGA